MSRTLKQVKAEATRAHQAGEFDAARRAYGEYLSQVPHDGIIWSNLGVLHRSTNRHRMALRSHRRAFALSPQDTGVRNNLSNTLSDIGKYEESIALRRQILEEVPNDPNHLAMIGRCYRGMGDYDAAIAHLSEVIKILPDDPEVQMQLAFAYLGRGDYAKGFELYKARWRAGELRPRNLKFPEWQGQDLSDKTLLVLPEQGFGDAVLFMRFLPSLAKLAAKVRVLVDKPLLRLFSKLPDIELVTAETAGENPADYWINMMDMAAVHFARSRDIPPPTQLHIPDDATERAAQITGPYAKSFKVGVVWAGSVTYKGNAFRSFAHRDFLPLVDIPDVQLFSLYKGPLLTPYYEDGSDAFMVDTASTDRDFADCAATMSAMDLVITSDTVSAHMASSLGIETWTVLHWDPFWVYTHAGDTTPWYPGMRLFRQKTPLDWSGVMAEVEAALVSRLERGT
ncbi:Tetratricopeptide repeat-containing protein [Cognatiyoonia koreensis]|uniref:Tetratricopeptide repeat-containing protein n=1 Tax=Cognatiyoonia koreensis TaxID=364200 RepID=A0A1I0RKF0_9RHOB|nr:tetratricopeptide repeat protein [Cognatiyoonia koreensis]SEW41445.1 Tetratricopeptide repeat-containing protein [Cognatiyoonia koreensis]